MITVSHWGGQEDDAKVLAMWLSNLLHLYSPTWPGTTYLAPSTPSKGTQHVMAVSLNDLEFWRSWRTRAPFLVCRFSVWELATNTVLREAQVACLLRLLKLPTARDTSSWYEKRYVPHLQQPWWSRSKVCHLSSCPCFSAVSPSAKEKVGEPAILQVIYLLYLGHFRMWPQLQRH